MVNNSIKVYARIKNENKTKRNKLENYIISKTHLNFDDLVFHHRSSDVRFSYYQFRYHKVFDQPSSQVEIFEIVAKPVVSSVIHGFNGTIFAYGQTGSGKTYSITGCPKTYENRGIIPRCIEHIFEYLNQNPDAFTVHLSYLEIYNEIGYDLLNPKQIASKLEEFPRVILLEDAKGEAHLRNLSIHSVCTEKDAMRLLFLGDTNRTIAETPMNDYSSRSHCIFTIYLRSQLKTNNRTIKSKLHVVDLAGSERIGKSTITGNTLNEAKSINLSLHYLEQVISALTSSKKHIPFRNSMLTYLLKDSLCGNSLTTMLATMAITKKNIEETISTCKFSKRVSMITTQPIINEVEPDSQQEINILQNEIYELKTKLLKYEKDSKLIGQYDLSSLQDGKKVRTDEPKHIKSLLDDFLNFKLNVVDMTLSEMKYCMEAMRDICKNQSLSQYMVDSRCSAPGLETSTIRKDERNLPSKFLQELGNDKSPTKKQSDKKKPVFHTNINNRTGYIGTLESPNSRHSRDNYTKKIEEYKNNLESTYEEAKAKAEIIEKCRENIITLRTKMDQYRDMKVKEHLFAELYHQQDIYRKTILDLRTLEKKTNHLKLGLLQTEMKSRKNNSRDYNIDNEFSASAVENEASIWQKNTNRVEPNDSLSSPNTQYILDSMNSLNRSSNTFMNNDFTDYSSYDFNRPEKENDGAQAISTIPDEDDYKTAKYPEERSGKSPFFLELLADDNCTLANDELGFPLETQDPIEQNWYSESHENHNISASRASKSCDTRRKANGPLRENPMNITQSWDPIQGEHTIGRNERNKLLISKKETKELKRKIAPTKMKSSKVLGYPEKSENYQLLTTNVNVSTDCSGNFSPPSERNIIAYKESDSAEFKDFIKSVPLTGDKEVDEEILNFYRSKFKN